MLWPRPATVGIRAATNDTLAFLNTQVGTFLFLRLIRYELKSLYF